MKLYLLTGLLIIAAVFTDCTIKKRSYRDGYFVSWNKKAHAISKVATTVKPKTVIAQAEEIQKAGANEPIYASIESTYNFELASVNRIKLRSGADSCGDIITMRNGKELSVKVIEVGLKTIKYRTCDNLNGPLFVVNTDLVFKINYINGSNETFSLEETKVVSTQNIPNQNANVKPIVARKFNNMAITSFVLGFFFWLIIPGILSLIFGAVALSEFKRNPDKYKGKWMALFWLLIFGVLVLLALLLTFGF